MSIIQQFNLIAEEYDCNRRKFIPCFEDYYITSTRMILNSIPAPQKVLDIGAGTGLLTYYWYLERPECFYTVTDIAEDMLNVSRRRFKGIPNIQHYICNYAESLPREDFDAVISALSIHHLENNEKQTLFKRIFAKLPIGGVFVNYDQFKGASPLTDSMFSSFWENQLSFSGLTDRDLELWKERKKLDRECTVEEEILMLKSCGFSEVSCIYSYHKFSVILAVK